MTNKELAERIVANFERFAIKVLDKKILQKDRLMLKERTESILSEYQGEAVGEISGINELSNGFQIIQFTTSKKYDFAYGEKVYLSAPIKKEESSDE